LFGHEKGAFTGAGARRVGRFEQADSGTLFLDEVAELYPATQAKLLRVLQERRFHRLGGSQEISSDFRLITATHRDLNTEVQSGAFRQDLYFRIAVFELELPALVERGQDILLLARHFARNHSPDDARTDPLLEPAAERALMSYPWPGNVRELQNAIERAALLAAGRPLSANDLPERVRDAAPTMPGARAPVPVSKYEQGGLGTSSVAPPSGDSSLPTLNLCELERHAIEQALASCGDNLSEVARLLGIGRTTLYRKLNRLGLR
jgi:DNA-binding NtrC family response regulator